MEAILSSNHNLKANAQKGFTILEVLIAFVILAVGLLGIVELQFLSKKFTHQAAQRTLAVSYADAIIERIRANPGALLSYTRSTALGGENFDAASMPDCSRNICSASEIAQQDLQDWEHMMDGNTVTVDGKASSGLISAKACFDFLPASHMIRGGLLTVRVQWAGLDALSDAVTIANTNCNNIAANTDPFRRQLLVNTYVFDQTELEEE